MKKITLEEFKNLLADETKYIERPEVNVHWNGLEISDMLEANGYYNDLSNLDLRGCNLKGADLAGCNLSKSVLSGMDLTGIRLQSANLQEANLIGVKLNHSWLDGANFSKANLAYADLTGIYNVNLIKFEGANLCSIKSNFKDLNPVYAGKTIRFVELVKAQTELESQTIVYNHVARLGCNRYFGNDITNEIFKHINIPVEKQMTTSRFTNALETMKLNSRYR